MQKPNLCVWVCALTTAGLAQAQRGIGEPAIADPEAAEAITASAMRALSGAPGFSYTLHERVVYTPDTAVGWTHASRNTFIGGGGRFRADSPGTIVVCDGEQLNVAHLNMDEYYVLDVPAADDLSDVLEEVTWDEGRIWLAELAVQPGYDMTSSDSWDAMNHLGFTEAEIDGRPGTWVYQSWESEGFEQHARVWHDAETNLPSLWELDYTEHWIDYLPSEVIGFEIEHIVYRMEISDWQILDEAPDPGLFAFNPGTLSLGSLDDFNLGGASADALDLAHLELINNPAPAFDLPVFGGDGRQTTADFAGSVVVLDFWATWCGPCLRAMPELQDLSTRFEGQPVRVVGINTDRGVSDETIQAALDEAGVEFMQLRDDAGDAGSAYSISSIPCTVLIDAEGVVRDVHVGFSPTLADDLEASIREALDGVPLHDQASIDQRIANVEAAADAGMPAFAAHNPGAITVGDRLGSIEGEFETYKADLDGDGTDETIAWAGDARVTVFREGERKAKQTWFRSADADGWSINDLVIAASDGAPVFVCSMSMYSDENWEETEAAIAAFDAEGNELWLTAYPINGSSLYHYIDAADLDGDGSDEIVLGEHIMVGDWGGDERAAVEIWSSKGKLLARSRVGDSLDGVSVLTRDGSPTVFAVINGSARAIEFDPAALKHEPLGTTPRGVVPNPEDDDDSDQPIF